MASRTVLKLLLWYAIPLDLLRVEYFFIKSYRPKRYLYIKPLIHKNTHKLNNIDLIGSSAKVAVGVLLLLSLFLLTVQTKNKLANRLFSLFLLLIAFDLTGFFIYHWVSDYPHLSTLKRASSLLQMPLFYLYVLSMCYYNFRLRWVHLWHASLFGAFFIALIPRFYLLDTPAQVAFLNDRQTTEMLIFSILGELQYYIYIALTIIALRKFKRVYLENYATEFYAFYRWLWQMIIVFLVAHLFALSKSIIQYGTDTQAIIWANMVVSLIATGVSCWFVLKALYQPALFRGIDAQLEVVNDLGVNPSPEPKLDSTQQEQINTLQQLMQTQEPFLDPTLNIQQLADLMDMPPKELSQLINVHMEQNFFNLVNSYRVEKAQEILRDPNKQAVTVLEILYEVGFNSKSSFNTAFKKHASTTPTQYRKTHLKSYE